MQRYQITQKGSRGETDTIGFLSWDMGETLRRFRDMGFHLWHMSWVCDENGEMSLQPVFLGMLPPGVVQTRDGPAFGYVLDAVFEAKELSL